MLVVRRFTFSFPHFSRPTTHEKYDVLEWYVTDSFLINTRMNRRTYCSGESNGQMQCKRSRAFLISTTWNTYSGLIGNTKATRTRHGWVHMFITHRPTLTLQLHNFDLFRTCRTALLRGYWQDFNWHDASRGSSAIAELFVIHWEHKSYALLCVVHRQHDIRKYVH